MEIARIVAHEVSTSAKPDFDKTLRLPFRGSRIHRHQSYDVAKTIQSHLRHHQTQDVLVKVSHDQVMISGMHTRYYARYST